jgi:enoyl-CoA hydratase
MAVTYELDDGGVVHVRMDDGKANALNDESCSAIDDAIARSKEEGAGALVIHGREGMFSAGIDLTVIRETDAAKRAATLQRISYTMLRVWTAPLPTVAAVTGHAIAGGAILAMACDRRIALDTKARIGVNESALGMVFPTWATAIATAAIKPDCRNEAFLFGRLYDPENARRVGIVDAVAAADVFDTAVAEAAAEGAALPTKAFAANKRVLRQAKADAAAELVAKEMGAEFAKDF